MYEALRDDSRGSDVVRACSQLAADEYS